LIDNFDLISFEKLSIQNMVKNHRLAKSISDASWYQLQMFTSYKAEWAGKIVEFVDPKYTSQNCSNNKCGKLVGRVTEGDIFICHFCGLTINVHVNAANNIRDRSIEYQKLKKDIELISTVGTTDRACLSSLNRDAMIQEAPAFRRE
jgi:putative transposase